MRKNLNLTVVTLETDKSVEEPASKLRGYIGNKFKDHPILHHHSKGGKHLYTYPRVQYKVLGGTPVMVGIEEGAEVLEDIAAGIGELRLGKGVYDVESIRLSRVDPEFGSCKSNRQYRFLTHWLALNPSNYEKFKETQDWKERKELLNSILVGNVLSLCKGLDFVVDRKLYAHTHIDMEKVEYKGIPHIGFKGEFRINFTIPDLIGLGMGVSQGFGTLKKD